jgi:hypothetical protein
MTDYEYIKQFKAISIKNICIDLGLEKDYRNILNGVARKSKIAKVRKEIEKRIKRLEDGI